MGNPLELTLALLSSLSALLSALVGAFFAVSARRGRLGLDLSMSLAFSALAAGYLAGTAARLDPASPALAWLEASLLAVGALVAAFSYAGIARTRHVSTGVLVAGVILLLTAATFAVLANEATISFESRIVALLHGVRAAAWIACTLISLRGFLKVRTPVRLLAPMGYALLALAATLRLVQQAPTAAAAVVAAAGFGLICLAIVLPRSKRSVNP